MGSFGCASGGREKGISVSLKTAFVLKGGVS